MDIEKKAEEYCNKNLGVVFDIHSQTKKAYIDGYEAAMEHLCKIPFDKMLKEMEEYMDSKDEQDGKSTGHK